MSVLGKLVKFVTANVSFGTFGKICYCKCQFWEYLGKFVKIWENLVLIYFTKKLPNINYQSFDSCPVFF